MKFARFQVNGSVRLAGKYLAIRVIYKKPVEEAKRLGVDTPKHQVWFNKQTTCICGLYDAIRPDVTEKLDYEVELGVVIGRRAKAVATAEALSCVFGYLAVNDVSARDWRFHSPTFTIGKSFDTHDPIGPWLVTADEIADPQLLGIECLVNGQVRQRSTHRQHAPPDRRAGRLSLDGLHPGARRPHRHRRAGRHGREPPTFLQSGDVVRCGIERMGSIENRVA